MPSAAQRAIPGDCSEAYGLMDRRFARYLDESTKSNEYVYPKRTVLSEQMGVAALLMA